MSRHFSKKFKQKAQILKKKKIFNVIESKN